MPDAPPRLGGGPYYAALALRALARPGAIAAKCGAAERDALLPPLAATGLPVRCLAGRSTTTFAFAYEGERRQLTTEALGDVWTPAEADGWVARALGRAEWVHVAPLLRGDFPPETLERLARGRRLSFDAQGLVRPRRLGPVVTDADYDQDLLQHVSILKLSEGEARILVDGLDEAALGSFGVREVVVTLGSRGAVVFADGVAEHVPP